MPILNYTTTVAAEKTMGEIQAILARSGARKIATDYDEDGEATGLSFVLDVGTGFSAFSLPVRADRILQVMKKQGVQPRYLTMEQARRTAWRITKDWLRAQLAIVESTMVNMEEVMLPYMHAAGGGTFYERYLDSTFPALEA